VPILQPTHDDAYGLSQSTTVQAANIPTIDATFSTANWAAVVASQSISYVAAAIKSFSPAFRTSVVPAVSATSFAPFGTVVEKSVLHSFSSAFIATIPITNENTVQSTEFATVTRAVLPTV